MYVVFRRWLMALLLVGGGMVTTAATALPRSPHVIHLSADGLGGIHLRNLLTNAPEFYPNFRRLLTQGAGTLNAHCDYTSSETLPNHTSMVTGRPVQQPAGMANTVHHGFIYNYTYPGWTLHNMGNPNLEYVPSVFDVIHDHGLSTALYVAKTKLGIFQLSYDVTQGAPDLVGDDNGNNKVDQALVTTNDSELLIAALPGLLLNNPPNYLFLHLHDMDSWGHYWGWGTPLWNAAVGVIDGYLGMIFACIDSNPELRGHTAIILTADHGGGSPLYTHAYPGHPLNYTIPLIVWGPGWPAGADLYTLFSNRFDPGGSRPDYTAPQQPLRNGDSGNLALLTLGLPPVPGSFMVPQLWSQTMRLTMTKTDAGGRLRVSWPSTAADLILEASGALGQGAVWTVITEDIGEDTDTNSRYYDAPFDAKAPPRFFRLRKD